MKKWASLFLAMAMLLTMIPAFAQNASVRYEVTFNEANNYYTVTNPNGAPTLTYAPDTGISLIEVEQDGFVYAFKDLSKDGVLDVYEDWRQDLEIRAEDLASKLTIEQISALRLNAFHGTAGFNADGSLTDVHKIGIGDQFIRYMLFAGRGATYPAVVIFNNNLQRLSESKEWGLPVMMCSDPRNGAASVEASLASLSQGSGWPTNLAMGATFNPDWALLMGQAASQEYRAMGISMALSPQIDVATEPRWSRVSGTYGEGNKLTSAMAMNYVSGFQSTWNGFGLGAEDLGWGKDSVITMLKHYPGDAPGEAGREAHNNYGKYAVYPGNNFDYHLAPFSAAMHLDTKTKAAYAVMPSYSIAVNPHSSIGDPVGSGFSSYKLITVLREELGFKGLVCSDWGIRSAKTWGLENASMTERYYEAYMNGLDQFGLPVDPTYGVLAYNMGVYANTVIEEYNDPEPAKLAPQDGKAIMDANYRTSAKNIILTAMSAGLYESAYISSEEAARIFNIREYAEAGYAAQLASVTMVKNQNQVIAKATGEKKTVYIPMKFKTVPNTEITDTVTANDTGDWSRVGFETYAANGYAFDINAASKYFNVVTDQIREGADTTNLKAEDILYVTDFSDVDFALITMKNPSSNRGYDAKLVDMDGSDGTIDNGYTPISLIYGEYYADPAFVREYPIAVDANEELTWVAAGGEVGRSRYYGGKTVVSSNEADLDFLLETAERVGDLPIALYLTVSNPMCFYEFEPEVDAIVIGFGVCLDAALEVLSGQYEPNGLLPLQMPANMETVETQYEDVPFDMECHVDEDGNAYDYAFGLNWSGVIHDARVETYR